MRGRSLVRQLRAAARILTAPAQASAAQFSTASLVLSSAAQTHPAPPGFAPPQQQAPLPGPAAATPQCHTAAILDGRAVAAQWLAELSEEVQELTALIRRPPGLAVVLVGSRPDSLLYVSRKEEACQKAGVRVTIHHLPESVSQSELEAAVAGLCASPEVDGVLVQLPLPPHLCEEAVMEHLDPRKDVDSFHPLNMGRMLMRGRVARLVPCTPLGCMELLERCGVTVRGKSAVVLGDSNIVGTPLAALLRNKGAAAVTVCHQLSYKELYQREQSSHIERAVANACLPRLPGPAARSAYSSADWLTPTLTHTPHPAPPQTHAPAGSFAGSLPAVTRGADILVVAVGVPQLVRREWVKPGAVVIDVGINVVPQKDPVCSAPQCAAEPGEGPGVTHTPQGAQSQGAQSHTQSHPPPADDAHSVQSRTSSNGEGPAVLPAAQGLEGGTDTQGSVAGTNSRLDSYLTPGSYQVVGDCHHEEVSQVASALTPVPGGVGPMTIAAVLANTLRATRYHCGLLQW